MCSSTKQSMYFFGSKELISRQQERCVPWYIVLVKHSFLSMPCCWMMAKEIEDSILLSRVWAKAAMRADCLLLWEDVIDLLEEALDRDLDRPDLVDLELIECLSSSSVVPFLDRASCASRIAMPFNWFSCFHKRQMPFRLKFERLLQWLFPRDCTFRELCDVAPAPVVPARGVDAGVDSEALSELSAFWICFSRMVTMFLVNTVFGISGWA